jgi:murein DD-endopeptidase MepM/ murein hydrolase activator NlpD
VYLKELRHLQKQYDIIEMLYKHKLYKSIHDNNTTAYYILIQTPLPFIKSDARLKRSVVNFYKQNSIKPSAYLEDLSQDFALDERSYTYSDTMFKTAQTDKRVSTRKTLKDFIPNPLREPPVEVVMIKTKKGYNFYLENHAYYNVSLMFKAIKMKNLTSSLPLPFIGTFKARTRIKFLSIKIKDFSKPSILETAYSTQMGALNPDYDRDYLYALPYARDKAYLLTQGFKTSSTHQGKSAYALDFKMPIGTKVHAMREGIVVALEDKQTAHGFSKAYLNKSNYIIIEHEDGTLGMYGHLKAKGLRVQLGQKVYKHQFIALSGNTGFSSGPHLHVHISRIKEFLSGLTSVPFRFKSSKGTVSTPVERNAYLCK